MRIVLVDDHPLITEAIALLFQNEPDIDVMGSYVDEYVAIEALIANPPDILLLDLHLTTLTGLEVIKRIQHAGVFCKTIMYTADIDEEQMIEALQLGVRGVVTKDMSVPQLIQCLRKVHAGGEWLEKRVISKMLEKILQQNQAPSISQRLTPREQKIALLLADGMSNSDIANGLFISENMVKTHVAKLFKKLGVNNRVALVNVLRSNGWL